MEAAIRELMGAGTPPRFKFKDTYASIEFPSGYTIPAQATLEAKYDELLALEGGIQKTVMEGDLEVGTSNLFVDTETGNVGIGTTNPAYTLDVAGTAYLSNIASTDYSKQFSQTYDLDFDDITATDEELSLFQFEPTITNHAIIQGEVDVDILSKRAQTYMHFQPQKVKIKFSFSWDARATTGSWVVRDIFVYRTKSSPIGAQVLNYPVEVRYKYKGDRSTDPDIPPKVQVYLRYNGSNFVAKINVKGTYHSNYTDYGLSFPSSIFTTDGDTTDASVDTMTTYDIGTGKVGIGTSSPNRQLQIYGDSSNYFSFSPTEADDTSVDDKTNFGATSMRKQMMMRLNNRTWYWGIVNNASNCLGLGADGGGGDDPDIQCVFQNNGTFWTKNIRTSGSVGIGTTSPGSKLDIYTGSTSTVGLSLDRFSSGNYRTDIYQNSYGPDFRVGYGSYTPESILYLKRLSNGSKEVEINGNVGIGTTSPNGNLHIMSDLANASSQINPSAQLVLHSSLAGLDDDGDIGASLVFTQRWLDSSPNSHGTMGSIHGFKDLSAGNYGGGLLFKTQPGSDTAPVERMRIDRDGNVGIGTASPDSRLVVEVGGTNNTVRTGLILRTPDSDIGTGYNIDFHQSTTLVGRITSLTEGGGSIGMAFSTYNGSTTERMRIASNGNVGIGTASPLTNLDINGDLRCPSLEAQYTLSGGGDVTWTGTYVKWSTRVIALPVDPNYAASGHYNINCPTSGTITYYANSGDTTKTCTSSGIPLGDWDSLYYVITKGELSGSGSAPINGNFIAVQYTNTNIKPQTNWLFICGRNSDNSSLKWMPGQQNLAIGTTLSSSGGYTYKQYTLDEAAGKSLSGAANNESITIAKKGLAFVSFSALIRASATNGTAGVGTTACYASLRKNSTAVTEYIGYRWATYGYTNDTDRWRALNLTWSGPVDTGDVINFYVNTAENTIGTNGSHFSVLVI